jgi:hypothetical protein
VDGAAPAENLRRRAVNTDHPSTVGTLLLDVNQKFGYFHHQETEGRAMSPRRRSVWLPRTGR